MCTPDAMRQERAPGVILRIIEVRRLDALDCALVVEVQGVRYELRVGCQRQGPSFDIAVVDFSPSQVLFSLGLSAPQIRMLVRVTLLFLGGEAVSLPLEVPVDPSPV